MRDLHRLVSPFFRLLSISSPSGTPPLSASARLPLWVAGALVVALAIAGAGPAQAQQPMSISKTGTFQIIDNGNTLEYTFEIEVCNNGTSGTGFVVGDQLPTASAPCAGTFVSASAPGLSITASNPSDNAPGSSLNYDSSTEQVSWDSGADPIPAGTCQTLTIVVQYDANCAQDLTNRCQFLEGDTDNGTDSFTFNPNDDLPVDLTAFTAVLDRDRATLRWTTATETNNAGFDVQHRAPGAAWTSLGFVEGAGTTGQAQSYRFDVPALAPGPHAFRLRQVDDDGTATLSREVSVAVALDAAYELTWTGANPFRDRTALALRVAEVQAVTVAVYDLLGRRVLTLHDGALPPLVEHRFALDARTLAPGSYFVRVAGETFTTTRRATLVR
jgi:hypothetical protein